jgi:hypothetical protein
MEFTITKNQSLKILKFLGCRIEKFHINFIFVNLYVVHISNLGKENA